MKRFAQLFQELDQTTKTLKKVASLANFFDEAEAADKLWAIALLAHKRPKRIINTTYLKEWAAELSGVPMWLFEESYHVVGDLAETISLFVDQEHEHHRSLSEWILYLESLRKKDPNEVKIEIQNAWQGLNVAERFIFNKLITGGFRIGVSQKLMVKGLAKSENLDEKELTHRLMGNWNPFEMTFDELIHGKNEAFQDAKPYPFFLAYPVENHEKELGDLKNWFAEYKWDGIRGQVIHRNGSVSIWSRGEELVTEKFPELAEVVSKLPDGTVLDGEIVPWKDDKVLDFQLLQTRIGRKTISKKNLEDAPVRLIAYDILEHEGEDIRSVPLEERKKVLAKCVKSANDEKFILSELMKYDTIEKLETEKDKARELGAEGLMLKKKDSTYEVGRKKGGWYKWKVDPYTIDAVLTYAMRGHGRRANLYTDYTFGLWQDGSLVTFAKAYSGLTDEEFRKVDAFVKRNTLGKFGPVRQVKPELVFELAFEGIALSSRHKSGVSVRFPRMHRWRHDKKPEEANTLDDLKAMKNLEKR